MWLLLVRFRLACRMVLLRVVLLVLRGVLLIGRMIVVRRRLYFRRVCLCRFRRFLGLFFCLSALLEFFG